MQSSQGLSARIAAQSSGALLGWDRQGVCLLSDQPANLGRTMCAFLSRWPYGLYNLVNYLFQYPPDGPLQQQYTEPTTGEGRCLTIVSPKAMLSGPFAALHLLAFDQPLDQMNYLPPFLPSGQPVASTGPADGGLMSQLGLYGATASVPWVEWDAQGRAQYWSAAAEVAFGWSSGQVLRQSPTDWGMLPDTSPQDFRTLLKDTHQGWAMIKVHHADDSTKLVRWQSLPLYAHQQPESPALTVSFLTDMTPEAEERLRQQQMLEKVSQLSEALSLRNAELTALVYKLSHEVRGPVASYLAFFNMLETVDDPPPVAQCLHLLKGSTERFDSCIHQLTLHAQLLQTEPNPAPTDLSALIAQAWAAQQDHAQYRAEALQPSPQIPEAPFRVDAYHLRHMLTCILKNCLDFCKASEPPLIAVSVQASPQGIQIRVADNGQGMSRQALAQACEMFYRGTAQSVGAGLGLYIAAQAAKKLGGRISLRSQLGEGTQVYINLPGRFQTA